MSRGGLAQPDGAVVMNGPEVVALLRLDEETRKDGSVRKRAMPDALRSLYYLARTGQLMPLPGCGKSRRYARSAVLSYLSRTSDEAPKSRSIGPVNRR